MSRNSIINRIRPLRTRNAIAGGVLLVGLFVFSSSLWLNHVLNAAPNGLVAAYNFDEGSGTALLDRSGNNNNGVITGATWNNSGKYGKALSFNASRANNWVTIADSNSLDLTTGMTLEAWVRPNVAGSTYRTILIKQQPSNLSYDIYSNNSANKPVSNVYISGDKELAGPSQLPLNSWSHVAATYDGATQRLFINGVQVASRAQTGAIATSNNPLRIGGNSVWPEWFGGLIDDVRVYNRALSVTEIQTDMNTPVTASATDTTPPAVSLSAPAANATVSGTSVTVSATASDNVGVAGVQFKVDGTNVGSEDTTSPYSITWNSTTVANGTHTITAVARDAAGNTTTSGSVSVTVSNDLSAPIVSLTSPTNGSSVQGDVMVAATATDDIGVVGVQFKMDGNNLGSEDTTAPYSTPWNTLTVANGTHTLTAVARDAAGKTTTATTVTVTVVNPDIIAPLVSITAPAPNSSVAGSAVTVSASATDSVGVVGVQFKLDGADLGTEDTSAPYSVVWDARSAGNGPHTLTAVARDAAGNTATAVDVPVVVDNDTIEPTVVIVAPSDGATVSGNAVSLLASANDNIAISGVQFVVDGVNFSLEDTSAPYTTTLDSLTLPNGTHTITAIARDTSGNTATAVVNSFIVTNDLSAPSITITSPTNGSIIEGTTTVTADASDDIGVVGVQFKVDGNNLGTEDTTAPYEATWSSTDVNNGNHTINAIARDASGRTTTATAVTVSVSNPDITAPSVSITAPTEASNVAGSNVAVSANATDNIGVVGVQFKLDGADLGTEDTTAPYSTTWDTRSTPNGSHTLTAIARDAAGNTTTATTINVTVNNDTTPPTASVTAPTDGSSVSGNNVSLTANASDNVAVAGVQFVVDGTNFGAEDTTAPYSAILNSVTIPNGSHTVSVIARDTSGNTTTSATNNFTVNNDTTPPAVSLSAPAANATVYGSTVAVSATASDNVGVAGVQFKLDGINLSSEDTTAPYSVTWNSTTTSNGTHTLTAVARDAAGNTTTATNITVTVSNSGPITPVAVPEANAKGITVGDGFVEASARQVVRTSDNKVYVIAVDDNICQGTSTGKAVIHAWKGVGAQPAQPNVPTSFSEVDAANRPASAGTGDCTTNNVSILFNPDVRLDRSGVIHLAYIDGSNGTAYYRTFSTATDTWGTRVTLGTGAQTLSGTGWPRAGQLALSLDANDIPHVVYASNGTSNQIRYTNRLSGTWSTPVSIATGTNIMHPSMVTALDGSLHLAWLDNSVAAHSTIKYARYAAGAWGASETVSLGDNVVLGNGNDDQGPGIATDTAGTPHVIFMDGTVFGTDNYVRMRYRAANGTWTDNTPPGGNGGASNASSTQLYAHTPQNYISNTNGQYVFLGHDRNVQVGYQYQLGGVGTNWAAYKTFDPRSNTNPEPGDTVSPGLDGSASIRFDPLRDNNPGIIDVLYFDELNNSDSSHHKATVYYKALVIDGSATSATDTTPPAVSLSAPAANATVSGTSVTVSATASDNVGVAGVQFKVDGTNVGSEDTTSPYSITWNSTTVANGTHTITAVARDAAGNTTTSGSVSVTVSNTTTPPPPPPVGGLVSSYNFNEGTGTTLTDRTGTNTGTTSGGPVWTTAGKFGGALTFDGVNDIVNIPDSTSLDLTTGLTLEAWVRPTALGNLYRTVLIKEQPNQLVYALYANSSTSRPTGNVYVSADNETQGTSQLALNTWTHLATTFDGTTVRLYVNGALVSSKAASGSMPNSSGALRIGGNTIWSEWFAGQIDEVRIYNKALTATEIQTDMNTAL